MTDEEFRRFVCSIMDIDAPRRLHGLTEEQTRGFLGALRMVLGRDATAAVARQRLKTLSEIVRFEKKVRTPGE